MSLLLAYTFNDNNASSFADFSGNKQTGSGTLSSIVAGQNYGYAANFGATNNYITVTPSNFSGVGAITVFASIYMSSLSADPTIGCYLIYQSSSFNIHINSSGNIVFTTSSTTPNPAVTLTSAGTLSSATWYTIGCVADGSNMYIYINGVQDANTAAQTHLQINNNAVYIGNDTSADTSHTFAGKIDCIEVRSIAASEADMYSLNSSPGGIEITNTSHNFATGDLIADSTNTFQAIVTWVVDSSNFYIYPLSEMNNTYSKIGNVYQSSRQYFTQLSQDFDGNGNGQIKIMFPIAGWADYASPANNYTYDKNGFAGLAALITGSTAVTQTAGDNSTKIATTAYVDGKTIAASKGGTGIDSSASTGVAQVSSGTWSVSTALASGTTATTQSPGDNTTKVATTAYVDAASGTGAWTDWSGTIAPTGYSGSPTITSARYKQVGKICFLEANVTGTSNSSSAITITLPVAAKVVTAGVGYGQSGATASTCLLITAANSTTGTVYFNMSASIWTASGTKQFTFTIVYETV